MTTGTHPYVVPDVIDENLIDADIVETKLVVDETDVNMGTGGTVHALTYNGAIPGPTFRLNVGDTVIVRLINHLMHPWVIGYRRNAFVREFFKFVDVDAAAQQKALRQ